MKLVTPHVTPRSTDKHAANEGADPQGLWCPTRHPPCRPGPHAGRAGAAVGVSNRVIAYYKADGAQPPGALLIDLARTLRVSTDALLGVAPVPPTLAPKTARLLKRLQPIADLPPADQRAILKLVDALLDTRRRTRKAS